MNVKIVSKYEAPAIKSDLPELKIGDTLKCGFRIQDKKEGERIQYFEGILIRMSGSGVRKTMTVRKIGANGVGVEKIVPLHAPVLASVKVVSNSRARRAKLYYLRDRVGKSATEV